ncbi:MAG: aminotransferase class V-fold PLP-dependent enzyme, partial [Caldimicrobium sp.]
MEKEGYIYLDYNATTPVLQEVLKVFEFYASEEFGNASSGHRFGRRAKEALEKAREAILKALSFESGDVIFTSGGTEANHLALFGIVFNYPKAHILVSAF